MSRVEPTPAKWPLSLRIGVGALGCSLIHSLSLILEGLDASTLWPLTAWASLLVVSIALFGLAAALLRAFSTRRRLTLQVSRQAAVLLLLLLMCWLYASPGFMVNHRLLEIGLRARVQQRSDPARLQMWAQALLEQPVSEAPLLPNQSLKREMALDPKQLPDFVTSLAADPGEVRIVTGGRDERYIRARLGGWIDGEWDLMLGSPSLASYAAQAGWRFWQDGVFLHLR